MIVEVAPAKINLALHVRRRRPDGYHELETLFAFARDGDEVAVEPADADTLEIVGPFAAGLLPDSDNLVVRARDAFRALHPAPPVAITLAKNLPIASGIGGGSADAAATLRALARLVGMPLGDPRLHHVAATLGADVPACLLGQTSYGTGLGEELKPIPGCPGLPLLLVNPGVAVSTAAVFRAWDGVDRGAMPTGELLARGRAARNDLAPPARTLAPVIAAVEAQLAAASGVLLSRMSGSGATCFALFEHPDRRDAAAAAALEQGWWCLATELGC